MFSKLHNPGSNRISVEVDGVKTDAELGETVAAVLLRQEEVWSRLSPVSQNRRAPYCMMGVCFECLVEIDGIPSVQSCLAPVSDGMKIVRQLGKRKVQNDKS